MAHDLRRDFTDRDELIHYVRERFPDALAVDDHISPTRGGRYETEGLLRRSDSRRYAKSRNYLGGAVTRLTPYIRHGALSLAEVHDNVLSRVRRADEAGKLWAGDNWQRLYDQFGDGVWRDQEPYKTGYDADSYAVELPRDIAEGTTGLY